MMRNEKYYCSQGRYHGGFGGGHGWNRDGFSGGDREARQIEGQRDIDSGGRGYGQGGRDYCRCNPERPSRRTLRNLAIGRRENGNDSVNDIKALENKAQYLEDDLKKVRQRLAQLNERKNAEA